jgi:hypothetical protein
MSANNILPAELAEALRSIGAKLEKRAHIQDDLEKGISLLNALPASAVGRAEKEIVESARLYHYWRRSNPGPASQATWSADLDQLERLPDLQYLFVFHGDGTIREAALRKIAGGLPSPFLFAAVAWRLNDWALPVRKAAAECARRTFPLTAADVIARAAVTLLSREHSWARWTDERAILLETFGRSEVALSLADIIGSQPTGGVTAVLRRALQLESFDPHLQYLAQDAVQPTVRALALQTLIDGVARWPRGFEMQWIDKSMGRERRVKTFNERALSIELSQLPMTSRRQLIVRGSLDRSAIVRKIALDGLIRFRSEIPDAREIAAPLMSDRAAYVRERAQFLSR